MLTLDDFTPASAIGPQRAPGGETVPGRLTTTDEQRTEAIEHIARQLERARKHEGEARVIWHRGEPTTLRVTTHNEHLQGKRVAVVDSVTEILASGAEVAPREDVRLRVLTDELRDLVDKDMLK